MSRYAIALSLLVVVALLPGTAAATPATDGAATAAHGSVSGSQGPVTNVSNATITLTGSSSAGAIDYAFRDGLTYPQITQLPRVDFGTTVDLAAGEFRLRYVDLSTGNAVVLDPSERFSGRYVSPGIYEGDGSVVSSIREEYDLNGTVTTTGPVTNRGITRYEVELIDEDTGRVVDTAGPEQYVVGWDGRADATTANGTVRLTLDRDVLAANRTFEVEVFDASVRSYYDTTDRTTLNLSYENATDQFVGTFRESEVDGGAYHVEIETTNPGVRFQYISRFYGQAYYVDAPTVVGTEPATDPDDDGVLEDVNGDGTVSLLDVQALYVERNSTAVRNNSDGFDANFDGSLDLLDVQKLFDEVT